LLCLAVSVLVWSLAVRLTALFLHSVVVILLEQINDDDDDDVSKQRLFIRDLLFIQRFTFSGDQNAFGDRALYPDLPAD